MFDRSRATSNTVLAITALALSPSLPLHGASEPCPDWVQPRIAEAADMALFDGYLGTFRGSTHTAPSGRQYHFGISYSWYDRPQRILRFVLTTELPDTGESRPLGEGFYRFDPVTSRIEVYGVFRDGRAGRGCMSPYDPQNGSREVAIDGQSPEGSITPVRDTFWIIDDDSWGNRTFVRGDDGEWREVSDDVYRRVEGKAPAGDSEG